MTERAYSADVAYTNISPGFRNDLGFISRGDIGLLAWDAARHFRSTRPESRLRVLSFGTLGERFENSEHTSLSSRRIRAYSTLSFADGGGLNTNVDGNYERLMEPFEVSQEIFIPAGEYRFAQVLGGYSSNASQPVSFPPMSPRASSTRARSAVSPAASGGGSMRISPRQRASRSTTSTCRRARSTPRLPGFALTTRSTRGCS